MRSYVLWLIILAFASTASCATDSSQNHADDLAKCTGYGYQQGTDQFANCMMKLDSRRQHQADSQKQNDSDMKALSIRRNGDERFPVCSAGMMDANLDTTNNAWYGPNCREK
jgi:hypothetical protein